MQVKALCGGDLLYDKVSKALMRMFGADHKPNPEDLMNAGRVNVLDNNMTFCGAEVGQSLDFTTVSISLADYVKQVKPISIDKHRKTMVDDVCNDVEKKQPAVFCRQPSAAPLCVSCSRPTVDFAFSKRSAGASS